MTERHEVLVELLETVHRGMLTQIKDVLDRYGLPAASMIVMRCIRAEQGITISELSRRTGLAKSHVSKIIEGLVGQGLVDKQPDPFDQRLVRLRSTEQAGKYLGQMQAEVRRRLSTVVAVLPGEQVDAIIDGLQALKAVLEQGNVNPQPGDVDA